MTTAKDTKTVARARRTQPKATGARGETQAESLSNTGPLAPPLVPTGAAGDSEASPAATGRRREAPHVPENGTAKRLHYVGIGASAGGLEALRPFVASLPRHANMTYIVAQHMSPDHRSLMVELLQRETELKVESARNNILPKADRIYVAPPNTDITVADGKLRVSQPTNTIGPKPSVDRFFMSLADDREDCAIGVILSGTGSDGARGIKAIKAAGGIAIAQEPKSAKYDSMPHSAIRAGGTDLVLQPHEIADQLLSIVQRRGEPPVMGDSEDTLPPAMRGIVRQIAAHAGMDFTNYKDATISRQILRRMAAMQISNLDAYADYVHTNRQELTELAGNFLICVTSFFRDADAFESLRTVLRDLLKSKRPGDDIRIWIPGCATGEEVYSVAIILAEELGAQRHGYRIQLFATDINLEAVEIARAGIYPESALSGIDSALITRHFHAHDGMYHIDKSLRDMVLFARQDLVLDPPFVRLDMITCRNLLIYFKHELQERVMKVFHYALRNHGILFLGKSESIGKVGNLFVEKDRKHKIFLKRPVPSPIIGGFARMSAVSGSYPQGELIKRPASPSSETLAHGRLLDLYAPPSLLVTPEGDILEIFGDCSPFLSIKKGKADFNVFHLIKPNFRAELRAFAHRVRRTGKSASGSPVEIVLEGEPRHYRMTVHTLGREAGQSDLLLVSFETIDTQIVGIARDRTTGRNDESRISELELEVAHNHENLQTVIEELETANEELQSMHEEAQAANEELQASNEELETANEELQASNEELITVNDELSTRTQQLAESTSDLTNVLNSLYKGVLVVDRNLAITRYNQIALQFFDIPEATKPNLTSVEMKIAIPDMLMHIGSVLKNGKIEEIEFPSGDGRYFTLRMSPYVNGGSKVISGVVLCIIDISERMASEEKLRLSASVFEHAFDATMVVDADMSIISVNPAFTRITGYSLEDVIGQKTEILSPDRHSPTFFEQVWNALESNGVWQGEIDSQRKNGESYTAWLSINVLRDKDGAVIRYIVVFSDISRDKLAQETIQRQATQDALTGLPNRNLTLDRLSQLLSNCRRTTSMFAVLFMDLDHFKLINDSLGHVAGDELLVKTAQRIKSALRDSDTVGRMGGDEFIVLLDCINSTDDVVAVANSILAAVGEPLVVAGHTLQTTASIGVTVYPVDGASPETLLKNADNAMYEAKKNGRNTFCFFTHHMQEAVNQRHWIDRELGAAVPAEHLNLYYQPIIRLDTMALGGAEALLRWRHPDKGFISPDAFVPVAEQSGRIGKLSQWVINTGLRDWAKDELAGEENLSLSFNLSAAQFVVRDHIEEIVKRLETSELARRNLITIEITESLKLSDNAEYVEILKRLRQCGCRIAIDDFGSGYSSLSYLKRMPIDIIKIDKAFVRDITSDAADAAMVRAILQMAEAFGMDTVAEGVETAAQLDFLQTHGCSYAQGHYFSEAVPYAEFSTYARVASKNGVGGN